MLPTIFYLLPATFYLLLALCSLSCYTSPMTITQTIEIPANSRSITLEIPREVPTGKTIIAFTPMSETESITEKLNKYYKNHNSRLDDDLKAASYRLLAEVDW